MQKKVYEFISKKIQDPIIERKTCPRTGEDFAIFKGDMDLLQKISPKIGEEVFSFPYPKLDPTARMIRRMMFRNERYLYSSKSFISDKTIPTIYHPDSGIKNITAEEFETIDTVDYSQEYNFNHTFLDQFTELFYNVPKVGLITINNENGKYDNFSSGNKNTFLNADIMNSENVSYSTTIKYVKNGYDLLQVDNSDFVYDCLCSNNLTKCVNVWYSSNCYDSGFLVTCRNCDNCWFCDNLENKSNYVFNKPATQEKINKIKNMMKIYDGYQKLQNIFQVELWDKIIRPDSWVVNCEKTIGSSIRNSQNAIMCFDSHDIQDCKYCIIAEYNNQCMDTTIFNPNSNSVYQAVCGGNLIKSHCCVSGRESSNMFFCDFCIGCEYMIGCCGMKNKKYCIFNKQYTKEERFQKAHEIFAQMDKDGLLGKFFPGSMNPFYFNDTAAYLIDDTFTKEEVEAEGYLRRDEKIKVDIPEGAELVKSTELSQYQGRIKKSEQDSYVATGKPSLLKKVPDRADDFVRQINPEILKKVIVDPKGNYYKIVKMEYDFLMKYGLPLPEIHWLDRIKLGFKFK